MRALQLSIYAMAAREKWGYESERLVFYNLEENSAVATVRDRLQLEGARAKVEDVANPALRPANSIPRPDITAASARTAICVPPLRSPCIVRRLLIALPTN